MSLHSCVHVNAHVCKCVSMCVHCDTMIPNSDFHSDSALACFSFCLSTSLHSVLVPFNLRGSLCQPELITYTVSYFLSCIFKKFCVIDCVESAQQSEGCPLPFSLLTGLTFPVAGFLCSWFLGDRTFPLVLWGYKATLLWWFQPDWDEGARQGSLYWFPVSRAVSSCTVCLRLLLDIRAHVSRLLGPLSSYMQILIQILSLPIYICPSTEINRINLEMWQQS